MNWPSAPRRGASQKGAETRPGREATLGAADARRDDHHGDASTVQRLWPHRRADPCADHRQSRETNPPRGDEHQERRAGFDVEIQALREHARTARAAARARVLEKLALERSPAVVAAREALARLRYTAELERLRRTRDALITSSSLHYLNFRPTAWWFPLVSPDGRWFDRLVATAQARVEEL